MSGMSSSFTLLSSTVLYSAVLYPTVLYAAVPPTTVLFYSAVDKSSFFFFLSILLYIACPYVIRNTSLGLYWHDGVSSICRNLIALF